MTKPKDRFHLPIAISDFAKRLLIWYRGSKRDLPWRADPQPYKVWLSEMMLQQTQVKTVIPYFERFIHHYPELEDLARAPEAEVLDRWAGLGYYSRARNLHKAAQVILQEHQGTFPDSYEGLMRLPGIGRYSAGAILSIAFNRAYPIMDGNVRRVLARILCVESPINTPVTNQFWKLMEEVTAHPSVSPSVGDFNQAMMELGALVCTPKNPDCTRCPLKTGCLAQQRGIQETLPRSNRVNRSEAISFTSIVIEENGRFLMHRSQDDPFLKGFWEFPKVRGEFLDNQLEAELKKESGIHIRVIRRLTPVRHQITFRKLTFFPVEAALVEDPDMERNSFRWIREEERGCPMSAYVRKIFRQWASTEDS